MRESKCKSKSIIKWMLIGLFLFLTSCGSQSQGVEKIEEEVPEKQLTAELGTIVTSGYDSDWQYHDYYIIPSQEELDLFLYYMKDSELEEDLLLSTLDFAKETLLMIPITEGSTSVSYTCKSVVQKGEKLELNYKGEGYDEPGGCMMVRHYLYAVVPNSELAEAQYEGWIKPSEVIEGEIPAELGVIRTEEYVENWNGEQSYIIQSHDELKLFFKGMDDKKLKKNKIFDSINFEYMTLLMIPVQTKTKDSLCECEVLAFQKEQLKLQYSLQENGKSDEGIRFYVYAIVLNGDLKYDTYEDWLKPSEVFGE